MKKALFLAAVMWSSVTYAMCYSVYDASNTLIFSSESTPVKLGNSPSEEVQRRFPGGHMIITHSQCDFFDSTSAEGREATRIAQAMKPRISQQSGSKSASTMSSGSGEKQLKATVSPLCNSEMAREPLIAASCAQAQSRANALNSISDSSARNDAIRQTVLDDNSRIQDQLREQQRAQAQTDSVKDAVKDAVKDGIRNCLRFPSAC